MAEGTLGPPARLDVLACGCGVVRLHFRSDSEGRLTVRCAHWKTSALAKSHKS